MRFQGTAESAVQISGSRVEAAIPTQALQETIILKFYADESSSVVINQQFTITVFGDQPAEPQDPMTQLTQEIRQR